MIQTIVEGHGEVSAMPVLVRNLAGYMNVHDIAVASPIRRLRSKLVKKDTLEQAVELAKIQPGCQAILVLLDADDDCPKTMGPNLQLWAAQAAQPLPCAVILANREYECWFLSCIESLRGRRGILNTAISETNPEDIRDGKGRLEAKMENGRKYLETTDQAALTAVADWKEIHNRCRSFRKLAKETRQLLAACGRQPSNWPWDN